MSRQQAQGQCKEVSFLYPGSDLKAGYAPDSKTSSSGPSGWYVVVKNRNLSVNVGFPFLHRQWLQNMHKYM